jgi:polyribonucleotide 5'-hydroxyl-kinase
VHSLHLALERERILARRAMPAGAGSSTAVPEDARGPRVMILGPASSGKTTIVKNLVNMALGTGMGWNVGVAGLDPSSVSSLVFDRN